MEVEVVGRGPPVLIFHGIPGSRIDARFWSAGATELGVDAQFVAFDRPGYGRSVAQPGRTLRTVAEDAATMVDGRVRLLAVSVSGQYVCVYEREGARLRPSVSGIVEMAAGRKPRAIIQTASTISCTPRGSCSKFCAEELPLIPPYIASK